MRGRGTAVAAAAAAAAAAALMPGGAAAAGARASPIQHIVVLQMEVRNRHTTVSTPRPGLSNGARMGVPSPAPGNKHPQHQPQYLSHACRTARLTTCWGG